MLLPFDAHNHIHMGPTPIITVPSSTSSAVVPSTIVEDQVQGHHHHHYQGISVGNTNNHDDDNNVGLSVEDLGLSGMAVMSTHPRDFSKVLGLSHCTYLSNHHQRPIIIPCIGVHPWFLHELSETDWSMVGSAGTTNSATKDTTTSSTNKDTNQSGIPKWVHEMEQLLIQHHHVPIGEIGLDNFHFDPISKELTCPMATQVQALEYQLSLAVQYQRPVSIHCVRSMGPIMNTIQKIQLQYKDQTYSLPPRMYFHAFGGKAATVTQLIQTLEKKKSKKHGPNNNQTKLYFGFAPVINFDSPKTIEVIQTVGLERLVLETDHEDAALVQSSMELGVQVISQAFQVTPQELIAITNQNVKDLYEGYFLSTLPD